MLYLYRMECCSALTRKGILAHAITWVKLEDMMLIEMCGLQRDQYCMTPVIRDMVRSQTQKQTGEWWLLGTGGGRMGITVYWEQSFSVVGWKEFWIWMAVMAAL